MLRFNFATAGSSGFIRYLHPDAIFAIFLLLVVLGVDLKWEQRITNEMLMVKNEIRQLEPVKKKLKKIERKRKKLIKQKKELQKKIAVFKELEKKRHVPQFLYFFGDNKNTLGIWFDAISYQGNSLSIEGNSKNLGYLYSFIRRLDRNLGTVLFKGATLQTVELKNSGRKINYYKFQVNLELKGGISH